MRVPSYRAKWPEYARQWDAMRIRPEKARAVMATARRLYNARARYRKIERASGVPWFMVAVLHERIGPEDWGRLVLAYEPVWAIGTGRNATPDDAAQVHELIRFELSRRGVPGRVTILYGGSVNQGNVLSLLARPELDGVLVGGASLDSDGWAELVGHGG